jgi:hypothetical protein
MPLVTEAHLQHVVDHAQQSLHSHEGYLQRDTAYREILQFVDEMVDLILAVRRERAALEEIVRIGAAADGNPEALAASAGQMHAIATRALSLDADSRRAR